MKAVRGFPGDVEWDEVPYSLVERLLSRGKTLQLSAQSEAGELKAKYLELGAKIREIMGRPYNDFCTACCDSGRVTKITDPFWTPVTGCMGPKAGRCL